MNVKITQLVVWGMVKLDFTVFLLLVVGMYCSISEVFRQEKNRETGGGIAVFYLHRPLLNLHNPQSCRIVSIYTKTFKIDFNRFYTFKSLKSFYPRS